ncbi:MAG: DNA-binding domain-containing protein [bacterium]
MAPEGVGKALEDFPSPRLPIKGDRRLSAVERLDIYADMYFYRIRDALKEDFPATLKTIGEIRFHNLITEYLLKHPSTHFSLRYAGRHLPRFLEKHPLLKKWPYLSDLARFEWALSESFDAADEKPVSKDDLRSVPPERWQKLRFRLMPSFQLLPFSWNITTLYEKILGERRALPARPTKTWARFWRKKFRVFYGPAHDLERYLLQKLARGVSFGELCDSAARKIGKEKGAHTVAGFLQRWLEEELLILLRP